MYNRNRLSNESRFSFLINNFFSGDFMIAINLKNRHNRYNAIIIMWGESAMMESIEFLISLVLCLVYIGVPLTLIGVVLNKLGKGQNRELN